MGVYGLEHVLRLGSGVQDDFRCINIKYALLLPFIFSMFLPVALQTVCSLSVWHDGSFVQGTLPELFHQFVVNCQ